MSVTVQVEAFMPGAVGGLEDGRVVPVYDELRRKIGDVVGMRETDGGLVYTLRLTDSDAIARLSGQVKR